MASLLAEGRIFEIFRLNAQAGGIVIADKTEPGGVARESNYAGLGYVREPVVAMFGDGIGEGSEDRLLFQGEADAATR